MIQIHNLPLPVVPHDFVAKGKTKKKEKKPSTFDVYRLACTRTMQFFSIDVQNPAVFISKSFYKDDEHIKRSCQLIAIEAYNIMKSDHSLEI
ncbi:hypothetical protein RhiirA5_360351 [Rhizophagus irregularis]|uniref:Uncharacterized protein n=2 Tax=Rhizophagus irregularis TaxID=588596 RepID=A0A2N0PHR4_9GLOM|nr:hypothetical protein RhiirA5_360351 [Rhizophagus irregularis]UZO29429.1 hypothetical protein OCT59_022905 [Rhizophagus irregularis]GBC35380.1 hypothetical protein RIR_jg36674.t1 [Rhizophagus irregularis DAOM 181602=DAOM 197198]